MKLSIISGRSGSGKSTCLHVLEDLGYYCVDNIPASLLEALAMRISTKQLPRLHNVAVSIDARNISEDLLEFPQIFSRLSDTRVEKEIIFLDAASSTLVKRFSETRRKHPLSNAQIGLLEAIRKEKELLEPIAALANLTIDTSDLSLHQLRDIVKNRIAKNEAHGIALQFQSFGFKNGVPVDADIVYDARCLPNPYWLANLRALSGLDGAVIDFLESQEQVLEMYEDIKYYLERWLPRFEENNRSYITVAIGCTGGQHRSVFLCEKLKAHFSKTLANVQVRHKEFA
ncbi:MAG: RNase adapter RapZ [Pseudomonadales bacterium]|nr:RNase adapter RapZ [Pseudomonadales bacterium]